MSRRGLASPAIDLKPLSFTFGLGRQCEGRKIIPRRRSAGERVYRVGVAFIARHYSTGQNFQNYRRRIKGAIFQLGVGSTANWPNSRNQGSEPGDWRIRMGIGSASAKSFSLFEPQNILVASAKFLDAAKDLQRDAEDRQREPAEENKPPVQRSNKQFLHEPEGVAHSLSPTFGKIMNGPMNRRT